MAAQADRTMDEVMKLTRAGRLADATALIRKGLGVVIERAAPGRREAGVIDLKPPASAGGSWSAEGWSTEGRATGGRSAEERDATPPRAAAGAPPRSGSFAFHTVNNAAGSRRYKLYVPKAADGAPRPLVVMLHGCTQSPDDFAAGTRMNAVADELGLLVAYPEQPRAANASRCWNWFKPGDQRRDGGEPSLLAAVVRQVGRDVAVAPGKVFVAGLSAGGAAAAVMAHEYPDLFAGACVHSGLACGAARDLPSAMAAMRAGAPGDGAPARAVPTIVFHGTGDRTVAPANAAHLMAAATAGLSAPDVTRGRAPGGGGYARSVYRDGRGRGRAELWMLEGAGHAWSGGSAAGSYTDPRGPDASREMMRFFLGL